MKRVEAQLCEALRATMSGRRQRPPEAGLVVWNAFTQLARGRSYSGSGPNPISYAEIEAWARLMRIPLEPHHVDLIVALDRTWLAHGSKPKTKAPAAELTAGLFDARFG